MPAGKGTSQSALTRALVAYPDEGQAALGLLLTNRLRQAKVRVPHHAEHMSHTPVDHRLDHHVANGGRRLDNLLYRHMDPFLPNVHVISRDSLVMRIR